MVLRSVHEQHARVTLSSDSSLEEKAGGAAPLSFDMWLLLQQREGGFFNESEREVCHDAYVASKKRTLKMQLLVDVL
jgi:hypothetical protein